MFNSKMLEKLNEPCQRDLPEDAQHGYVHPIANRLLHWSSAVLVVFLAWTGLQIAHPGVNLTGFGVAWSIILHKIAGILLIIHMPVWLTYRIVSKRLIWRCLPCWCDFYRCGFKQIRFYMLDIFKGKSPPHDPRQLNSLQRITYPILMLIALPLAILTGVVLTWPTAFGWLFSWLPLSAVTLVHLILAYLFTFFIFLHVYLSTTGRKPWSHFVPMFTGWVSRDEIDEYERKVAEGKNRNETNP